MEHDQPVRPDRQRIAVALRTRRLRSSIDRLYSQAIDGLGGPPSRAMVRFAPRFLRRCMDCSLEPLAPYSRRALGLHWPWSARRHVGTPSDWQPHPADRNRSRACAAVRRGANWSRDACRPAGDLRVGMKGAGGQRLQCGLATKPSPSLLRWPRAQLDGAPLDLEQNSLALYFLVEHYRPRTHDGTRSIE